MYYCYLLLFVLFGDVGPIGDDPPRPPMAV